MKATKSNSIASSYFSFPMPEPIQPHFFHIITCYKKKGGKWLVYFRFLTIQKPTSTATATIIAATIIAISVVIKGASVGSGSIGPAGDGAGSTVMYVDADDL